MSQFPAESVIIDYRRSIKRARPKSRAFRLFGANFEMSEENSFNETADPANLTNRQRGHLAELAFMRKAASLGFAVAKPWGEGERYDVIVRVESACWRIQVKSVLARSRGRHDYRIKTSGGNRGRCSPYSAKEIDFLVAYIFPEDLWYVFPASLIERRSAVWVSPGSKRSKFEQYREAWKLMKPPSPVSAIVAEQTNEVAVNSPGVTHAQPSELSAADVGQSTPAAAAKAGST